MVGSLLLKQVRSRPNLERAWRVVEDNSRFSGSETIRVEVDIFREKYSTNIRTISDQLREGRYKFQPARGVPIPKAGKKKSSDFRPLVVASVGSRIVQRSILDVLTSIDDLKPYFQNSNSFGGIKKAKGQHLAAVPAAIREVLSAIGDGATHVVCADISGFFTKISKSEVVSIIENVVTDREFINLLNLAIKVELSNMAELRERADRFPIYDIGVAQGSSLSPLLGNIILSDFDKKMNEGDCRCIRYIDDFIILAPTKKAAAARMRVASAHLAALGMSLSKEKTHAEPRSILDGFDFLGIELKNGLIRPSNKAQKRIIKSIEDSFKESSSAFKAKRGGAEFHKSQSLLGTLRRVDGAIQGWGKHYSFCNDEAAFATLDSAISDMLRRYIGIYSAEISSTCHLGRRSLLGVESLSVMQRSPFSWPVKRNNRRMAIKAEVVSIEKSTPTENLIHDTNIVMQDSEMVSAVSEISVQT